MTTEYDEIGQMIDLDQNSPCTAMTQKTGRMLMHCGIAIHLICAEVCRGPYSRV